MLYNAIKRLRITLFSLRVIPHILVYLFSSKGRLFSLDLETSFGSKSLYCFLMIMYDKAYMRNLFYNRVGLTFKILFDWLAPEDHTLHMQGCNIGRRCHLEHSQSTFLNVQSIGDDFYCLHNVTIGNDTHRKKPIIGNNVKVYTGAVIVGGIVIGDNAIIAANSFVNKDVPSNVVVAGIPAKVVKYL